MDQGDQIDSFKPEFCDQLTCKFQKSKTQNPSNVMMGNGVTRDNTNDDLLGLGQ